MAGDIWVDPRARNQGLQEQRCVDPVATIPDRCELEQAHSLGPSSQGSICGCVPTFACSDEVPRSKEDAPLGQ